MPELIGMQTPAYWWWSMRTIAAAFSSDCPTS